MWVEFVVGFLPCSKRFFSGYSGFPLSSKTNTSKFQFDQESGRRRTTLWICYLQIIIYYLLEFVWERSKHFSFGVSDRFINSHNLFLLIVYWTLLGENCCWSLLGLQGLLDRGVLRSETATAYYSIQLLVDFLRKSELKIHVSYWRWLLLNFLQIPFLNRLSKYTRGFS